MIRTCLLMLTALLVCALPAAASFVVAPEPTHTPMPTDTPAPTPSPTPDPKALLDAEVDRIFRRYQTTGGSVVAAIGGDIVYARDYGYKSLGKRLPVDEHTLFRVASVTKLVSGIGLQQLIEQGKLTLDGDIGEVFGYPIRNPRFPDTPITLRHLMSHTASISASNGFAVGGRTVQDTLGMQASKNAWFLNKEPGTHYQYSNFGAGVSGAMMEAASQLSANAYMQQHVFAPLQITAAYAASLIGNPDDLSHQYQNGELNRSAQSYIRNGYEDTADPERHINTAYGGLWIGSRDLARLGIALCGDGTVDGVRLLKQESVADIRQRGTDPVSPYHLFVECTDKVLLGHTLYGHQGLLNGVIACVYYEPETGFVFAMATNGCSPARRDGVSRLSIALAEALYPHVTGQEVNVK